MRKILIIVLITLGVTSCGSMSSLYYWGGVSRGATTYENLTYNNYDKQTPESICALICMYEDMITNPRGSRLVPPPGICAEYGYMLFIPENAEIFKNYATKQQKSMFDTNDYALFFPERGKQMMLKEIELYPESAKFIAPLVERLSK
jgi:hypothetical protein